MDAQPKLPLSHAPKKQRSEARQKQRILNFRATPEEYGVIEQAAQVEGKTLGSYMRSRLLEQSAQTRMRRKPRPDVAALAKLTAELNRIGGNINQIARACNQGSMAELAGLQEAQRLLLRTIQNVRSLMGFEK